jgi:peptide/nickel transport system substrate-binding protein
MRVKLKRLTGITGALALGLGLALTAPKAQAEDLVISFGTDVTGINAFDGVTGPSRVMTDHIAEGLTRWVDGEMTPWLATEWTLVDDRTWEFKLRPDVTFHNGEPFNAEAVKFTVEAILDEANKSPYRPQYGFIDRVEAVDDLTVRIITKEPHPTLLSNLPNLSMIPPQYFVEVGPDGYRKNPIGTGPFKYVEHQRDQRAVIEANPDYWGGPQKWDRIIYRPIPEAAARASAVLAGEVDFAADIPPELRPMFEGARDGARIALEPGARFYLFMVNNKVEGHPTEIREVREALAYSIDREALARDLLQGTATPVSWMAKGTFGEDPEMEPLSYDPEKSKALLAEAGFPDGLDIVMQTPTGRYLKDREMADAISGQMNQAGFNVTVETAEWGVLMKSIFAGETAPIILLAWDGSDFDPARFNQGVLSSSGMFSQVDYADFDTLLQQVGTEMDSDKRAELIAQQRAFEAENFPAIYIVQLGVLGAVSGKLADWNMQADERYTFHVNDVVGQP